MKTSDLIDALGESARPARRVSSRGLVGLAAVSGAVVALAVVALLWGFRPMPEAMHSPSFWMKAAYTVALAVAGWAMASRLARPGLGAQTAAVATGVIVAALWALAAMQMRTMPQSQWRSALMGQSWTVCPFRILLLALPVFAAAVLALRRLAPTRLRLAGAAAGLLAGAAGATVYGLCCTETSALFTAVWYSWGIAASAAIGALLGPRLLRW